MLQVDQPHFSGWRRTLKRPPDVAPTSVGLLIAPVLLAIALLIKVDDRRGPVIFKQQRIGIEQALHDLRDRVDGGWTRSNACANSSSRMRAPPPGVQDGTRPLVTRVAPVLGKYPWRNCRGCSAGSTGRCRWSDHDRRSRPRRTSTPTTRGLRPPGPLAQGNPALDRPVAARRHSLLGWEESVRLDLRYWTIGPLASTQRSSLGEPKLCSPGGILYADTDQGRGMTTDNFSVLVVCTANQCRSPMAEFLFRAALHERGLRWQVCSAGTHAQPGLDMHPHARKLLERRGLEIGEWYTTTVDEYRLESANLVLTASREQRTLLAQVFPKQRSKIIPLLALARLRTNTNLLRLGAAGLSAALPTGAHHAGTAIAELAETPMTPADDLDDPIGRPYRYFKTCASALDRAIELILGG